jgi:hypothetical protein
MVDQCLTIVRNSINRCRLSQVEVHSITRINESDSIPLSANSTKKQEKEIFVSQH